MAWLEIKNITDIKIYILMGTMTGGGIVATSRAEWGWWGWWK